MDLIVPLIEIPHGNNSITKTDFFMADVDPLPDKTAHGVAKLLYSIVKYCSSLAVHSAFLLVVRVVNLIYVGYM